MLQAQSARLHCLARPGLAFRAPRRLAVRVQASGTTEKVRVQFRIPFETQFGQSLGVVGSFTNWDSASVLKLEWSEGNEWIGVAELPAGESVEYKYVILQDGSEELAWQPGENRALALNGTPSVLVLDDWLGQTHEVTAAPAEQAAAEEQQAAGKLTLDAPAAAAAEEQAAVAGKLTVDAAAAEAVAGKLTVDAAAAEAVAVAGKLTVDAAAAEAVAGKLTVDTAAAEAVATAAGKLTVDAAAAEAVAGKLTVDTAAAEAVATAAGNLTVDAAAAEAAAKPAVAEPEPTPAEEEEEEEDMEGYAAAVANSRAIAEAVAAVEGLHPDEAGLYATIDLLTLAAHEAEAAELAAAAELVEEEVEVGSEDWEEEAAGGVSPALAILEEAAESGKEEGSWFSSLVGGLFGRK